MNADIINRTIEAMCSEIKAQGSPSPDWRLLTEDELLYEAAICIFGSQTQFELAVATADRLRDRGLLRSKYLAGITDYKTLILDALNEPLSLTGKDGAMRWVRARFRNRLASLLATTVAEIYGNGHSLCRLLFAAEGAKDARKSLILSVWGFGPKQASLFLRRVGYCADLAVLDVHVLDYLHLTRGLRIAPNRLGRLSCYEEIEDTFREIASRFGHSLGCVDLATWLTMRVAKREAYL
ncbi:MAG: 8-oxoguanine DNA glycosylase [Acidithiobacillus ferrivorans]